MAKKKILLLIVSLFICKIAFGQFNYHISGKFESVANGTKLYLYSSIDDKNIDSAIYKDGFEMRGVGMELLIISINDTKFRRKAYFVLEKGKTNIYGKKDSRVFTVKGGKQNKLLSHARSFFPLSDEVKQEGFLRKSDSLNRIGDIKGWALYNDSANYIGANYSKKLDSFYRCHPESFHFMANIWGAIGSLKQDEIESRYARVSPEMKKHRLGGYIKDYLKSLELSKAINIEQQDTAGVTKTISFPNKNYILLDFWASWCGPCRLNNPKLREFTQLYSDKNFSLVSISLDDNLKVWKKAIVEDKMTWLNLSDLKGWNNLYSSKYGFRSIPVYMIIAPDGTIIIKTINELEKIEAKLKELFNN